MFEMLIEKYSELAPSDLDAVIAEAELAKRDAEARLAAAAAIVAARGSFREHGHRSMKSYLTGTINCSGTIANRIRKRADLIDHHAAIGAAFLEGRIGTDQVDLLGKAASHKVAGQRFAEFAPQLLDHAEHLEYSEFDKVVTHFLTHADPDGSFDDQQFRDDERSASVVVIDGAIDMRASGGSPQSAAEIKAVFDAAVEAEFDKDCAARRAEHGDDHLGAALPRTTRQRKFDALHSIFMASVSVPADAKTPEPLVTIIIDHKTAGRVLQAHDLTESADLVGVDDGAVAAGDERLLDRTCSLNGTPVHPDVALKAMVIGRVRRAVVDADSVTIDLGRTRRLFSRKAREAAQLLVSTCTLRGCDIPAAFCDIDHRAEWAGDDGPTNQYNAMPLCGVHDRWKHMNKIRSRRATNGRIYLIRADGSVVKPVGESDPDWAEPPPTSPSETTPAPASSSPDRNEDPWAHFGRPMTEAELSARRIEPDCGWTIRIAHIDAIRQR
ncbi:MAG: hypothetical protein QNM02_19560 [Acidimicrobiia bacterium]|nr:hypothetical protein [Acidimicrobiia bacterium]